MAFFGYNGDGAPGVPEGGMLILDRNVAILKFGDVLVNAPNPNGGLTIDYDDVLVGVVD